MQIKGKNLILVLYALDDAKAEIHNQIATCPDVDEYAEDIERLEKDKGQYEKLHARVLAACIRDGLVE